MAGVLSSFRDLSEALAVPALYIGRYDHSGDIGGLLTQGMRKVAEELGK